MRYPFSVSIIIPARNAASDLDACLQALQPSLGPGVELMVVDDGSTDATVEKAKRWGARVIILAGTFRGAGYARNRGVRESRGEVLVFVDADVRVHPRAVERALELLDKDPALGAVCGSYDDRPSAPGIVSVWRNLLHCYTHHISRRFTNTFWTGLGVMRRSVFELGGGFDAEFEGLEDMELGSRISREGVRLRLDPSLQGTHRKRWTLWNMVRNDVLNRAIPYTRLLMRDGWQNDLNVRWDQRASVVLTFLGLASILGAFVQSWLLLAGLACLGTVSALNWHFYRFLQRKRGIGFAVLTLPLHLLYFLYSGIGYLWVRTSVAWISFSKLVWKWG